MRNTQGTAVVTCGKGTTLCTATREWGNVFKNLEYGNLVKVEYCWTTREIYTYCRRLTGNMFEGHPGRSASFMVGYSEPH
jgi:hypothetical protein